MTILRDISYLWSIMHVIAMSLLLFEPRYSWRTTLWTTFAGAGSLLIINVMAMFWLGHGIIMGISFFTCSIPTLILFFLLSKYRDGRCLFLFCLSDTSCFWLLQITNFMDRLTGDTYIVLLIGRLIVFPLAEFLLWRYIRRPYLEIQNQLTKGWWWFAAIGSVYYILFMFTSVPVDTPMPDWVGLTRIVLVMLLMPLTYITIFNTLWKQMQIYNNKRQLELQQLDYNSICQKMEIGRLYRHDMRHHLLVLNGILQQGDITQARLYVNKLDDQLASLNQKVWCANAAINAVLTAYTQMAADSHCQLQTEVSIPERPPYSDISICVIIGNALENAIKACQDIPLPQRWINLQIKLTENQRLLIVIENSCPQPVEFAADGLPRNSHTSSESEHGLGLRSIKMVVEQNSGLLNCKWQEQKFILQVALFPPLKPNKN